MTNERLALPYDVESSISNDQVESAFVRESTNTNGVNRHNGGTHGRAVDDTSVSQNGTQDEDPFRYGWRYVQRVADDGTIEYDQIPLTLEDLLHPEEEDFRMQNPEHNISCVYLQSVLSKQMVDLSDALILSDVRVDWSIPGIKPFGPDITVILEGEIDPPDKGTYITGEDGIAPIMVIEITSSSTRNQDFHEKPQLMQQAGLPYYFVVDLARSREKRAIYGYELTDEGSYIAIRPNEQGWVWMEPVDLWLGLQDGNVACYDRQGNLRLNYTELAESQEAEAQRAEAEAQRAREADERAEAEAQRAREADERAEAEAQRAQEANERAEAMSAENQRLVDYLHSIGIDPATIPTAQNDG